MKQLKINDISWYVEDDSLLKMLNTIEFIQTDRRDYKIIEIENERYFLKFFKEEGLFGFFRRFINPRGKKEFLMGKALLSFSIDTPKPIGYGISKSGSYIVQKYLTGKSFIDVFYSLKSKKELIMQLAMLLKNLKSYKIKHNDLHLSNIIVENGTLYLIDLHKMAIKKHFLLSDEISNLTHSLAMIYKEMSEDEKESFFTAYGKKDLRNTVEFKLDKMWERWIKSKKKRAFKDTSIVKREKEVLYIKGTEWQREDIFKEVIKKDKKTEIHRYSDHIRKFYRDKRRLKRAWEAYVVLSYMALKVTPEVFFLSLPSFLKPGFIAMEDLKGQGEELDRFLDGFYRVMDFKNKVIFIKKLSGFLTDLFEKNIFHKDFKACNIFVKKDNGFLLLDMEDIVFKRLNEEDITRMFIQLNTTVPKYIRNMDRMRFFSKIVENFHMNKKELARRIARASLSMDIIYEGKDGLKFERFR